MIKLFIFLIPMCFLELGFSKSDTASSNINNYKSSTDSTILWNNDRTLDWSDFLAKPDSLSEYKAMTFVQIGLKSEQLDDRIIVEIPTCFYKNLSWTKSLNNPKLLKHEQLHFDIAELMARKIRKEFSKYVLKEFEIAYKDLKCIYRKYYGDEFDRYSKNYDQDTKHGTVESKQKQWELKIVKELKALEDYSTVKVIIKKQK